MAIPSRSRITLGIAAACLLVIAIAAYFFLTRDRQYDPRFDSRVTEPAYEADGPTVLYDHAHGNIHSPDAGYRPLLDLLRSDGYQVAILREQVTADRLAEVAIFVVVCASGTNDTNDEPAFTTAEIDAIDRWVQGGGSFLLITDHWPYGPAAASLANRFGVNMAGEFAQDPANFEPALEESHLIFSRENGLLLDHPITRGRSDEERIDRILTFTGQVLTAPAGSVAFLSLGDTATASPPTTAQVDKSGGDVRVSMEYGAPVPAGGRAQGVALELGEGRVVVLGEAGMLRAHHNQRGLPVGMNYPGYDNRQLALNIMHWLSRRL